MLPITPDTFCQSTTTEISYCIATNNGSSVYFFPVTFHPGTKRDQQLRDWRLLFEVLNQSFLGEEF